MDGRRFDEGDEGVALAQSEFVTGGTGHQREQGKSGIQLDAHEHALRAKGNNPGRQAIAHAADGGIALEHHILTADADKNGARRRRRRQGGERNAIDSYGGKPFV